MLVVAIFMGMLTPGVAQAAEMPEVNVTLKRIYTGTEHGTDAACQLTTAKGYSPADDTAEDDNVCTLDGVGYDLQYNIKSGANPKNFHMLFDIGDFIYGVQDEVNYHRAMPGLGKLCQSQVGIYTAKPSYSIFNGKQYLGCYISNITPNVNATLKAGLIRDVGQDVTKVPVVRVLLQPKDGEDSSRDVPAAVAATAQGYNVIGRLQVDYRLLINTYTFGSPANLYLNGVDYVGFGVSLYANQVDFTSKKTTAFRPKGTPIPAKGQYIKIDMSALPPGTIITGSNGSVIYDDGRIPITDGPLGSAYTAIVSRYDVMYIPQSQLPAVGSGVPMTIRARIAQDSPVLSDSGGGTNFNGVQPQPGQESASCDVDTSRFRGFPAVGGYANNDCAQYVYNAPEVPGNIFTKSAAGVEVVDRFDDNQNKVRYYNVISGDHAKFRAKLNVAPVAANLSVALCDTWNASDEEFDPSGFIEVGLASFSSKAPKPKLSDFTVQFRSGSTLNDGSAACGAISDQSGWYADPSEVPGGSSAISALRIVSNTPARLNDGLDFFIPMRGKLGSEYPQRDRLGVTPPLVDRLYGFLGSGAWSTPSAVEVRQIESSARLSGYLVSPPDIAANSMNTITAYTYLYTNSAFAPPVDPAGSSLTKKVTDTVGRCVDSVTVADTADWHYEVIPAVLGPSGDYCGNDLVAPWKIVKTAKRPVNPKDDTVSVWTSYQVHVTPFAPLGTVVSVQSYATTIEDPRIAVVNETHFYVTVAAALTAGKTVDKKQVEVGDAATYSVGWTNGIQSTLGKGQWIDVLPYNGDANGSKLASPVTLTNVAPAAGVTVEYTKTAASAVRSDPADASNAAAGSTVWCASATSGGACPSSLAEVTAVRLSQASIAPNTTSVSRITVATPGAKPGDVLLNRVGLGRDADLVQPVPSPDAVRTDVVASTVTGRVWNDGNRDGQNAASEAGYAGATVQLIDVAGAVVASTVTDSSGAYRFENLHSGSYQARVVRGAVVPADAKQTYSFNGKLAGAAGETSDAFALGVAASQQGVDFGFSPLRPALAVQKFVRDATGGWVKSAPVLWGTNAQWKVTVTNTGETTLSNVQLADPVAAGCATTIATLAPGASQDVECASRVTADTVNEATASASDRGQDLSASDHATATVSGSAVITLTKSITSVERDGSTTSMGSPLKDHPELIRANDVIRYAVTVTNTGDVPLTAVGVSDPSAANLACAPAVSEAAPLLPGAQVKCTASHTVVLADIAEGKHDNTATASGTAPTGVKDPAPATASATQPLKAAPGLQLAKQHEVGGVLDTGVRQIGDEVRWVFTVTNTGNVPVTSVTINDPGFSGSVTCEVAELAPGASTPCRAATTTVLTQADADAGQRVNTATASGSSLAGDVTSAEAEDTVPVRQSKPALAIVKKVESVTRGAEGDDLQSSPTLIRDADVVNFRITVTNTGDTALDPVTVNDPSVTDLACSATALQPGSSLECTASRTVAEDDVIAGEVVNTATANGTPVNGANPPAQVQDTARQPIIPTPGLTLTKTANVAGIADDGSVHRIGDPVQWRFTVHNTGNVTVSGVQILDAAFAADAPAGRIVCDADSIRPADATDCHADTTVALTQADADAGAKHNTATASGTASSGGAVTSNEAAADVRVGLSHPGISLEKKISTVMRGTDPADLKDAPVMIRPGDVIHYTFTVTNTGDTGLKSVTVADPRASDLTCPATVLAVGASMECTATHTVTSADIEAGRYDNAAEATGTPDNGANPPAPARDEATQPLVAAPSLHLEKNATVTHATPGVTTVGDTIRWTFTVTNTGNIDVRDVRIEDAVFAKDAPAGSITCTATVLRVGESTQCEADTAYVLTAADVDAQVKANTATATATAATGSVVSNEAVREVAVQVQPVTPTDPNPGDPNPGNPGDPGNPNPGDPTPGNPGDPNPGQPEPGNPSPGEPGPGTPGESDLGGLASTGSDLAVMLGAPALLLALGVLLLVGRRRTRADVTGE